MFCFPRCTKPFKSARSGQVDIPNRYYHHLLSCRAFEFEVVRWSVMG